MDEKQTRESFEKKASKNGNKTKVLKLGGGKNLLLPKVEKKARGVIWSEKFAFLFPLACFKVRRYIWCGQINTKVSFVAQGES